ncbi:hypothetical protein H4S06_003355, partial [Coemansia sp. BCRC 34490]
HRPVSSADIEFFASTGARIVHGERPLGSEYNTDHFGKYFGSTSVAVFPSTTDQVSRVLKHCNSNAIAVVTQGGNSGTAGGAMAQQGEIILSLRDMNKVRALDEVSGVLVADGGCVLEDLDNHVRSYGYIMPVDLGAKKKCMIGGNVSTS